MVKKNDVCHSILRHAQEIGAPLRLEPSDRLQLVSVAPHPNGAYVWLYYLERHGPGDPPPLRPGPPTG